MKRVSPLQAGLLGHRLVRMKTSLQRGNPFHSHQSVAQQSSLQRENPFHSHQSVAQQSSLQRGNPFHSHQSVAQQSSLQRGNPFHSHQSMAQQCVLYDQGFTPSAGFPFYLEQSNSFFIASTTCRIRDGRLLQHWDHALLIGQECRE